MTLALNATVYRNPESVFSDIDGDVVMMDINTGHYLGLNTVASQIWYLLEQPLTVATLIENLGEQFDAPLSQIEQDVQTFLQELIEQQLVMLGSHD
ncbi:PqqD family peptide modification chaperone [Celerinatantimonas sp. YJH-8]|uniref:PqqD family peptide modification chaperone n=1 Tax=Celerinatantimonas sp. YJH-8 TaxID=3228714 RepID=UPI0038C11426